MPPSQFMIDRLTLDDPEDALQDSQGLSKCGLPPPVAAAPVLTRKAGGSLRTVQSHRVALLSLRLDGAPRNRYRERRLLEIFRQNGWEGRQFVPAEPVLQQMRLMGKPDRELGNEIKETTEFKEEFLVKLFGEAFWSKSNAEFNLICDSVLNGKNSITGSEMRG